MSLRKTVPMTLPAGISQAQVDAFQPLNNWIATLEKSFSLQSNPSHPFHADQYSLKSVTIQAYDLFGSTRVGFLKVAAEVSNAAGETLPAAAFLRGPSVAMLVMLVPEDAKDKDERYVVMTVQPRVAAGSLAFTELPAGMVDGEGDFKGVAAKEIKEELGMTITSSELTCLSDLSAPKDAGEEGLPMAMYPSAGGCDEHITIFSCEKRVPRDTLADWTGKLTGLREHGERITLKLVPMKDAWREGSRDAKCLAAIALWEGLKREGKI